MNQHLQRITCLAALALGAFLPSLGFAVPAKQKAKQPLTTEQKKHRRPVAKHAGQKKQAPKPATAQTAQDGTWTSIVNLPPIDPATFPAMIVPMLMTDGSVIFQNQAFLNTGDFWKLTPDINGSYENGTWSQIASLPIIDGQQYAPFAYCNAVLPDGRVIVEGGEYDTPDYIPSLSNKGAIYDPIANTWTPVAPPEFFTNEYPFPEFGPPEAYNPHPIGDSPSVVLPDGTYMLGGRNCFVSALLDAKTLTWTETGFNKNPLSPNANEKWTILPNGKILTTNCYVGTWLDMSGNVPNFYPPGNNNATSEIYNPKTGNWCFAGNTVAHLQDVPPLLPPITLDNLLYFGLTYEDGPQVLRPDGTVICTGPNGNMAIYDSKTKTWSAGPTFPVDPELGQLGMLDAPLELLPNGNVLMACGPTTQDFVVPPTFFFEFTKDNQFIPQPPHSEASYIPAEYFEMIILPTGQVLVANAFDTVVQFYTPGDQSYNPDWAPVISHAPKKVHRGETYKIKGIRFNGMSQAGAQFDDNQFATNYPLLRITNCKTGHVFYCRTHDHSYMGVASNRKVHTYFDVPRNIETGKSKLEVVTNGIPSISKCVYVK